MKTSQIPVMLCLAAIVVLYTSLDVVESTSLGENGMTNSAKLETAYVLQTNNIKTNMEVTGNSDTEEKPRLVHHVFKRETEKSDNSKPQVKSLKVISKVSSRFSQSVIVSEVFNPSTDNKEAQFEVQIPHTAFMSNFTILVNGKLSVTEVKSKADAMKDFEKARGQNKTAGLVVSKTPPKNVRDVDLFSVSINVKGESSVTFELTYQELLIRRFGLYELITSVRPNQVVDKLEVFVAIYEPKGIKMLYLIEPGNQNSVVPVDSTVTEISSTTIEVRYSPTKSKQIEKGAISGDFIVKYDVEHTNDAGDIAADDGYFVHFFSPDHTPYSPLSKNVIFVIDISGSMSGDKIQQTRDALLSIIPQLRSTDKLMFILFDNNLKYWPTSEGLIDASGSNIDSAKEYVRRNVHASGGTNIELAVTTACTKLKLFSNSAGPNLIIFLTDGLPSSGITDTPTILRNIKEAAANKVSILSLGFGFDLDFDLLQSISYRNNGFARRIYTGVDAGVQLADFFKEVNTPLMYDVNMTYSETAVKAGTLTQSGFPQYFNGTELVVVGELQQGAPTTWDMRVTCVVIDNLELKKTISTIPRVVPSTAVNVYQAGMPKKLYIYWKIKDLLRRILMTDSPEEKAELTEFALRMALEYNLVTPLTSFIVVSKDADRNDEAHGISGHDISGRRGPAPTFNLQPDRNVPEMKMRPRFKNTALSSKVMMSSHGRAFFINPPFIFPGYFAISLLTYMIYN